MVIKNRTLLTKIVEENFKLNFKGKDIEVKRINILNTYGAEEETFEFKNQEALTEEEQEYICEFINDNA